MKLVFSCALLAGFIKFLNCQKFRCDYKYYEDAKGFLKYHEMPSTWHEAFLRCDMEGAKLATPLNRELSKAMRELTKKSGVGAIFTGLHTKFSAGTYFSVEGVPLSMIPHRWAKGEPNNHNNQEKCIVMLRDGSFADASCSETLPYTCFKKSNNANLNMNACGTTDDGYSLQSRTGSCYKFHRFPRTWSRAFMTCAAEGGYLMIINSETEAQVIREIYAKNGLLNGVGSYWTDAAFVGFHDWDEHGEWRTIQGQTLYEAGYNKFQPGEPNNASAQFCGAVFRTGMFDDLWCDRRAQFICEKDPNSLVTCLDDLE